MGCQSNLMLHGMRHIFKFSFLALSRVLTFNPTREMKRKIMLVTLTSNYTDSDIASFFKWLHEQEEGQMVMRWPHSGINDDADQVHVVMEIVSNEGNVMPSHFSPRSLRFNAHVVVQELVIKFWIVWVAVRVFSHDRYYPGVVDQAFSRSYLRRKESSTSSIVSIKPCEDQREKKRYLIRIFSHLIRASKRLIQTSNHVIRNAIT